MAEDYDRPMVSRADWEAVGEENARLREALEELHEATEPWMDEAAPSETLRGPWHRRFVALSAARRKARAALGDQTEEAEDGR